MSKLLLIGILTLILLSNISLTSAYHPFYTNYNEDYFMPYKYKYYSYDNIKTINYYYLDNYQMPHMYYPQGKYLQLNSYGKYIRYDYYKIPYDKDFSSYSFSMHGPFYYDWRVSMYR